MSIVCAPNPEMQVAGPLRLARKHAVSVHFQPGRLQCNMHAGRAPITPTAFADVKLHKSRLEKDKEAWEKAVSSLPPFAGQNKWPMMNRNMLPTALIDISCFPDCPP
jgi:hypothetical protein